MNVSDNFFVAVLPLGRVAAAELSFIEHVMRNLFHIKVRILSAIEIPEEYYNIDRHQYNASQLLDFVLARIPKDAGLIIGVLNQSIFLENAGRFIFGYAYIKNGAAIYSTKEIHFGLPQTIEGIKLKQSRSLRVILHEVGHLFGLSGWPHCKNNNCVMREVVSAVWALDNLSRMYCDECLTRINSKLKQEFSHHPTAEAKKK
jgi:archaemetzincin